MAEQLGTFWGISVGPGDPELLTLKGLRCLQSVPVVACPQSRSGQRGMAYGIIQDYLQPNQSILSLHLPFVRDPQVLQQAWQAAADQVLSPLQAGQDVGFICEGDVGLYSTFTHLARSLRQIQPQLPIQIIPGVCSPLAAAAALGQPLSIGSERIAILPALYTLEEIEQACQWADVVVLMKVASVFPQIYDWLEQKQGLSHASLIEWISSEKQRFWTDLRELAEYQPPYFSLMILRTQFHDPPYGSVAPLGHDGGNHSGWEP